MDIRLGLRTEGNLHEQEDKLDFSKCPNDVAASRHVFLVDECDYIKDRPPSSRVCSGEMIQRLTNSFKDVDALLDDFNRHAALGQKSIQYTVRSKPIAQMERL